jgi:CRP/FNR family transcriptional regulator, cyclic AMP receptor protein
MLAAKLIGSTRQRVNQILKDYETNSLLKQQYGFILLLDQANLEKLLA